VFQKAERRRARARILIEGPSGSGKSYGALLLAQGFGGKVAAIDTEHGSLSMYSDLLDFDVMELGAPFSPQYYCAAIKAAEEAGYDTLIIDSITHEWNGEGGCLDILEKTPAPGGNQWGRWATVTPLHQRFIETMLQSSMHIIATVRSKTEYIIDDKNKPKKAGTAPQQRDGMDYEFTMVFSVQADNHVASVSKDRTAQFPDFLELLTVNTGKKIAGWLNSGAEAPEAPEPVAEAERKDETPPPPAPNEQLKDERNHVRQVARDNGINDADFLVVIKTVRPSGKLPECTAGELKAIETKLKAKAKKDAKAAEPAPADEAVTV
jgi:hypothetical protein